MKVHSTNYFDTFIGVAEDTKADCGVKPPAKDKKTVAEMQFEMIVDNPYKFTSDDIFFQVFADRKDLTKEEIYSAARLEGLSTLDAIEMIILETTGDITIIEKIKNGKETTFQDVKRVL